MEKVILTMEQAETLESQVNGLGTAVDVVKARLSGKWTNPTFLLNQLDEETLIKALFIGYEISKTPEEQVREYYATFEAPFAERFIESEQHVIAKTLNLLGINIPGVNAPNEGVNA